MNPNCYRLVAWAAVLGAACGGSPPDGMAAQNAVEVTVTPQAATTVPRGSAGFAAAVTGTADRRVTWTVTESGGGTVSSGGAYTAPPTAGTFHVVATSVADSTRSGSAVVTVTTAAPVSTVRVSLVSGTLAVGQSSQASVELRDAGGNVLADRTTTWSSSAPAIASVSATGVVSALAPGSTSIVATSEGKTGAAALTVVPSGGTGSIVSWAAEFPDSFAGHTPRGVAFDHAPYARDTLFAASTRNGLIQIAWGTVGDAASWQSASFANSVGGAPSQPGLAIDHQGGDLHVLAQGFNNGEIRYWRIRPSRDVAGKTTGLSQVAHFGLGTGSGRSLGSGNEQSRFHAAAIRGQDGVERIAWLAPHNSGAQQVSFYFGVTSSAAGVAPSQGSDFLAADGSSAFTAPLVHNGLVSSGSPVDYWTSGQRIVQRPSSGQVLLFASGGTNHTATGPLTRCVLTPSGPDRWTVGAQINDGQNASASAVHGMANVANDDVYFRIENANGAASNATTTHFRRWRADGTVDEPLPTIPHYGEVNEGNNIAVSTDGQVGNIGLDGATMSARVSTNGTTWSPVGPFQSYAAIGADIGTGASNIGLWNGRECFAHVVSTSSATLRIYVATFR